MATRYSGTLKLSITLKSDDTYTVRIVELNDDARFETLSGLRLSPYMASSFASDSAEAYDHAARAALGFASYADEAIFNFAEVDGDDCRVIRRRA